MPTVEKLTNYLRTIRQELVANGGVVPCARVYTEEQLVVMPMPADSRDEQKLKYFIAGYAAGRNLDIREVVFTNDTWVAKVEPADYDEWSKSRPRSMQDDPRAVDCLLVLHMDGQGEVLGSLLQEYSKEVTLERTRYRWQPASLPSEFTAAEVWDKPDSVFATFYAGVAKGRADRKKKSG